MNDKRKKKLVIAGFPKLGMKSLYWQKNGDPGMSIGESGTRDE